MFIGHIGLALGAKRWAPSTSLGTLLLAANFVDVLWPVLLIAGIEHVRIQPGLTKVTPLDFYDYPWSHSLLTGALWAVGVAVAYYLARRQPVAAMVCAGLVISHWFLDLVVHRPDLPLYPGGTLYGLGLWHSRIGTATAEVPLFVAGLVVYQQTTKGRDWTGRWGFATLIVVLAASYVANLQGNPPPSVAALQWVALVMAAILWAWASWADAHRTVRGPHGT